MAKTRSAVAITRFTDRYRFLSNFYRCEVEFDGLVYPSVEHAYQAAKSLDPRDRRNIRIASSPGVAKRLGRKLPLRPDWDAVKQTVMLSCLESKFSPGTKLAQALIATHPSPLVEGNTWGDTYWGVDLRTGEGMNVLGKLLVIVREKLRKGRGRDASERREKKREYFRVWRARRAAALQESNREKHGDTPPALAPLPELPWAWSKSKSKEPLMRKEPGRRKT